MKFYPFLLLFLALTLSASKCKEKNRSAEGSAAAETKQAAKETKEQAQPPNDTWIKAARAAFEKVDIDSASATIESPGPRGLYASLERTPCFGRCPMYKLSLFTEGVVIYQVRRFVDGREPGFYKGLLEEDTRQVIINKAAELDYFGLNNEYPDKTIMIADLPETITFLNTGTDEKLITNKNYNTPDRLRTYEGFLDSLVLKREWVRIQVSGQE